MAMDRADALAYIKPFADRLFLLGKRQIDDSDFGYGPAIDEAFRSFDVDDADLLTTTIDDVDCQGFRASLRYYALDLVEWNLLTFVDGQVDAPLTNLKWSQVLKAVATKKAQALSDMTKEGIGPANVSWVRWQYDYLETDDLAEVGSGSV